MLGSFRGLKAQVADVSKVLQSARALVKAQYVVVFGDVGESDAHYIYNKATGESNTVKVNGVNCVVGLYIAARAESGFALPAAAQ